MKLPFTAEQFLDVFAAYNAHLWPLAAFLWMLSAGALVMVLSGRHADRAMDRNVILLLASHWAWSAVAYHLAFFSAINPAAVPFAVGFLAQAALLATAWGSPPAFSPGRTLRHAAGAMVAAYGLAYPLVATLTVHPYPQVPTFGVPCPTALFTIGILLTAEPLRPLLLIIPLAWSLIGGSAAVVLRMTPDYALLVAAVVLLVAVLKEHRVTRRGV